MVGAGRRQAVCSRRGRPAPGACRCWTTSDKPGQRKSASLAAAAAGFTNLSNPPRALSVPPTRAVRSAANNASRWDFITAWAGRTPRHRLPRKPSAGCFATVAPADHRPARRQMRVRLGCSSRRGQRRPPLCVATALTMLNRLYGSAPDQRWWAVPANINARGATLIPYQPDNLFRHQMTWCVTLDAARPLA